MSKKLLIIGLVWPEPSATAAGSRMLQLITFFLSKEYQITFASTAQESEHTLDLSSLGLQKESIQLNHGSFDDFIQKLNPSIVLFDRFITEEQFGWRVSKYTPDAVRILDTEDLHSLRTARKEAFKSKTTFTVDKWLQHDMTKREVASIYRSDCSLIISSYEMELLLQHTKMPAHILMHLPFQLSKIDAQTKKEWISFENRTDFICIGNGKHAPNIDAFLWLKNEIWPLIRKKMSTAKVHIYGAYLPQHIMEMHKPSEGFYVHGRVVDAKKMMVKSRLNLAPLRFGAGIKGKLVESMLCGTPSITTNIGAEGMHQELSWNGSIVDEPQEFANAAVELYQNQEKWNQAQENGAFIINKLYDKTILDPILSAKINVLENNLENHRQQNFIGTLLNHHTMASTTYMSRWIAEKNK
ncbi:MAG: glycosyltransferase [Flavobacteriaceae bacterium]|nr:MAG: glycosyltransferase [Flavobacteriaceae bacterium]